MEKPLSSSLAKVSASSLCIPIDKDFHFYNNFDEFKNPIKEIADKSQSMLGSIGRSSVQFWGKDLALPEDYDEAYDWLVNVNDEVLERFDCSADEFKVIRENKDDNGFQLVSGKKKKGGQNSSLLSEVKVVDKKNMIGMTKPRVPFHIPTIPRPQNEYKILVNNSNQPFEHVWLQRSEDGSRFIHPLEKVSILDFIDKNIGEVEPAKPPPVECTPFKLVEEVRDLKELAAKLRGTNDFAVDLEHNQYRSFQGLTCLMQISTRAEDFIVDTLKLRIHIGPYLREVFKDPTKKKVMHGADRDIVWLQRDFGIYICNLFDTGQASRVLKMERNSLEYLLNHFCGVVANKEYQNADWRLRPLTNEMIRYAREDTHYLLHIYDLMRSRLLSSTTESEHSETPLVEVYQRSYDICIQLYEKDVLTDSSYLYIYGLQGAELNAQQLAVVAGLCEWRDIVARAEDESTGFILPNKTLLDIAKEIPLTTSKLRRFVKSKHQYIDSHLSTVVSIIKHSIQNAATYEAIAEQLKEERMETKSDGNLVVADGSQVLSPADILTGSDAPLVGGNRRANENLFKHLPIPVQLQEKITDEGSGSSKNPGDNNGNGTLPRESFTMSETTRESNLNILHPASGAEATVQVLKKPDRGFGALLGSAKRKFVKEKQVIKLEQIKSSVNLPFHSFSGSADKLQPVFKEPAKSPETLRLDEPAATPATKSRLEDFMSLGDDHSDEEPGNDDKKSEDDKLEQKESKTPPSRLGINEGDDEPMSLSDLSSSFKKCFQQTNELGKAKQVRKSQESRGLQPFKPFDYEAARNEVSFGENQGKKTEEIDESCRNRRDRKKSSGEGRAQVSEESGGFQLGRRRQAFPATGNRSASFR